MLLESKNLLIDGYTHAASLLWTNLNSIRASRNTRAESTRLGLVKGGIQIEPVLSARDTFAAQLHCWSLDMVQHN